jgi:nucleotide-binding universal stress UspA family protein
VAAAFAQKCIAPPIDLFVAGDQASAMTSQRPARWLVAGVDDSAHAASVVRVALEFADWLDLRTMLVHAVGGRGGVDLVGESRLNAGDAGQAVLESLREKVPGADSAATNVVFGDATERLLGTGELFEADLLVVGSRGRGPVRAEIGSSVSRRLARTARRPVVVVPPEVDSAWRLGSTLLCGVSDDDCSDAAVAYAHELATKLSARLILLRVNPSTLAPHIPVADLAAGEALDALTQAERDEAHRMFSAHTRLERPAADIDLVFDIGDPARRLQHAAEHKQATLLIVGSHGHGALRSLLAGSVSGELSAHSPVPVAIVPFRPRNAEMMA